MSKRKTKGPRPRQVKSPLTGSLVDGTLKGELPAGRRPKNYDHGPSEKALERVKRRQAGRP